jgi:hypothetical protein
VPLQLFPDQSVKSLCVPLCGVNRPTGRGSLGLVRSVIPRTEGRESAYRHCMASKRLDMGPWDYIVGGVGFAFLTGLFVIMGVVFLAWIATVLAAIWLMTGTVAQGVRVGMRAHRDDRLIAQHADELV